jgi:hypothetical protein
LSEAIHADRGINALGNTKCAHAVLQTRLCAVKKKSGHEAARRFCFNIANAIHFCSLQIFAPVLFDSCRLQLRVVLTFNRERWRAREN